MKQGYIFFVIQFFSLLFFISGCKSKKQELDFGYDYYPMQIGKFWIYDVIITETSMNVSSTDTFQIKEVVTDTFKIGGELRFRLERYVRNSENDPWPQLPDSIWSSVVTTQNIVRVENNIRYIKLIFPVEKGKKWNGNNQNYLGTEIYSYKSVDDPYYISGKNYVNTAYVLHEFDTSQVGGDIRFEVFSKGIGLVERYKENYIYYQKPNGVLTDTIETGTIYHEILNVYGN